MLNNIILSERKKTMTQPQVATAVDYTAKVHTTGGREGGSVLSSDGRIDLKISPPGVGSGTNPEQLFAAGWSTCFFSAVKLAAAKRKIRLSPDSAIDAEVDLVHPGGVDYFLQARLNVHLPGVDPQIAQELVDSAHQLCPYSKATRGNIAVTTRLV
jgi:Ohr subfamily peroxiredoxin